MQILKKNQNDFRKQDILNFRMGMNVEVFTASNSIKSYSSDLSLGVTLRLDFHHWFY